MSPSMGRKIAINGSCTTEIDYCGLHIVLLYDRVGIDYWAEVAEDPYQIGELPFIASAEQARRCAKFLMLTALNAPNEKSVFAAFRDKQPKGSVEKTFTDAQLSTVLHELKRKHKPIASYFASDVGIDLMNLDSQITEHIIEECTHRDIPVLALHDSYIVDCGHVVFLKNVMIAAMQSFTNAETVKVSMQTGQQSDVTYISLRNEAEWREITRWLSDEQQQTDSVMQRGKEEMERTRRGIHY